MSLRRLALTTAAMSAIAALLTALAPGLSEATAALAHAQRTVDTHGADALLLSAVGLGAWLVWTWGALGLALTAVSAAPGVVGGAARRVVQVLLPTGARRGAALALGVGLAMAAPVFVDVAGGIGRPVLAVAAAPGAVPDWPAQRPSDSHVVVRGDCLWDIAAGRLTAAGASVTDAAVADAVREWWSANADVIGPDPDLLLPGQVLRAPEG